MDAPNQNGIDLFEKANTALFEFEQFLRKREDADVCRPLYRMRIGLNEMFRAYIANQKVCDRQTVNEMVLSRR